MNFRAARRRRRSAEAAMDITSLVDVVFLLLIFLLVTTTFKKDEYSFQIELPTSSSEQIEVTTDKTTVYVDDTGEFHLLMMPGDMAGEPDASQAEKVSRRELKRRLAELHARKPNASIAIKGDRATSYQKMLEVVGVIQDVGFKSMWFPYEFGQTPD